MNFARIRAGQRSLYRSHCDDNGNSLTKVDTSRFICEKTGSKARTLTLVILPQHGVTSVPAAAASHDDAHR